MRVLCAETFYHEGRGAILVNVHLRSGSAHIQGIDYELSDSDGSSEMRRHLLFRQAQVYMFTRRSGELCDVAV